MRSSDHRGTGRPTHRPDLATQTTAGPVAIEVELRRKPHARLLGILRMYAECTDGNEAPLAGVLYVCDRADVKTLLGGPPRRRGWMRGIKLRTMDEVIGQTRAAAAISSDIPVTELKQDGSIGTPRGSVLHDADSRRACVS